MSNHLEDSPPSLLEPGLDDPVGRDSEYRDPEEQFQTSGFDNDEPLRPINWNLLTADEALAEWMDLNGWIDWLRKSFGLPPAVVPPLWHRHDELVWELSALHTHWLNAYDSEGSPSGPIGWFRDFAEARTRLREWVSTAGSRLDRDRPTRQTTWPGEPPIESGPEVEIVDRYADFIQFVLDDVAARRRIEEQANTAAEAHQMRLDPPSYPQARTTQSSDPDPRPHRGRARDPQRKESTMLIAQAVILAEARSHVAALADQAQTFDASVGYERVLLQLDFINGDDSPALDTAGLTDDRDALFAVATSSIEDLLDHGVDGLQIELVLDMLEATRDKDLH